MEIGDCVLLLAGHTAPITALAVAASGGLLASASADRTARVWELEKGQCLGVLRGRPSDTAPVGGPLGAVLPSTCGVSCHFTQASRCLRQVPV